MNPSYNDSIDGFVAGGAGPVISSGGDGMVLTNKRSGSRKLVAILVGLLAVIIIAGVVLAVNYGTKEGEKRFATYVNEYLSLLSIGEKTETFSSEELDMSTISNGEQKNIYTVPRLYSVLNEENTNYYNELQGLLSEIKSRVDVEEYNNNEKDELKFLLNDSETMLSYYFAAAALAYTNSDYEYYFSNKTLDGLLSVYGYPFEETDDAMLFDFRFNINALFQSKKNFYESIAETDCVLNDGVDYSCLEGLDSAQIKEIQGNNTWLTFVEEGQVEQMLNLIISDAVNISDVVDGGSDNA